MIVLSLFLACSAGGAPIRLDERRAEPGTWGYRPDDGAVSQTDPPSFSWRPQQGLTWEIECARDREFVTIYRPHRGEHEGGHPATFQPVSGGYLLKAALSNGRLTALLPADDGAMLQGEGMTAQGAVKLKLEQREQAMQIVELQEYNLR